MKKCPFHNCVETPARESDDHYLCDYHYNVLKYEKDHREREARRKGKSSNFLKWLFRKGPDHQFYVKGVGGVRQKQSNLHATLFGIAWIIGWIVIPLYLILAIIFI